MIDLHGTRDCRSGHLVVKNDAVAELRHWRFLLPFNAGTAFRWLRIHGEALLSYVRAMTEKIWAHSGDSHLLEPDDLWHQILPKGQADRMPRTERISENEERVTVDGKSFVRALPKLLTAKSATGETIAELSHRPPGSRHVNGAPPTRRKSCSGSTTRRFARGSRRSAGRG